MPASSSRRILVSGIFVLGLLGVLGYFVFDTDPVDVGDLEVFAQPQKIVGTVTGAEAMQNTTAPSPATPAKAHIDLEIRTLARVLPARSPRPTCELVQSLGNPELRGTIGTWVAGLAALPISPVFRGQQLVRFRLADGRDHYRVTRLVPADGERILLPRGMSVSTRGSVVDGRGEPLSGAWVWLAGAAAVTDAEGKFAIEAMPADSGLPLVVRKPGFAALYRTLSGSQYAGLAARPLTLRQGTELHVRFNTNRVDPDARYLILPAGGRDTRLLGYPFFLQAIKDGFEVRDGMVVVRNLPRGARVRVRVLHAGFAPATSGEISLDGPIVTTVMRGVPRPDVRGVVQDPAGTPVPNAWVTSRPGDSGMALADTGWLLAPSAYVGEGRIAQTDATGAFVLPRLTGARNRTAWTVQAKGFFGFEFTTADPGARVTLYPKRSTGQPALSFRAGARLAGTVLLTIRDEDGAHGPYGWDCSQPFRLRIGRRSLLQLSESRGGKQVTRDILVVDETPVTLGR